jgi:hypothetical protein
LLGGSGKSFLLHVAIGSPTAAVKTQYHRTAVQQRAQSDIRVVAVFKGEVWRQGAHFNGVEHLWRILQILGGALHEFLYLYGRSGFETFLVGVDFLF